MKLEVNKDNSQLLPSGFKMPLVGLGTWRTSHPAEMEKTIDAALEAGYRLFDTATLYKNEGDLGRVLKKWLDSGKIKRDELFITTKLPWNGMAPDLVERFLNSSLKRLQLDYLDLYLLHWPFGLEFHSEEELTPKDNAGNILYDLDTNLESVWQAMEGLVDAGKVKSIGICNFNEKQIGRIMKVAKIPPASLQIEIHAHFQNRELRQCGRKYGIPLIAYAPLVVIPISYQTYTVTTLLEDPVIMEIARKHSKTVGQILLRFLVQQNMTVIPKSSNPQRIVENISIFDFELTPDDMQKIEALDKGKAGRSFLGFDDMGKHPECPWTI